MNLNAVDATSQILDCPNCGGQMEIVSELDDFISANEDTDSYSNYYSSSSTYDKASYDPEIKTASWSKKASRLAVFALILSLIMTAGKYIVSKVGETGFVPSFNPVQEVHQEPVVTSGIQIIPGRPVYLEEQIDGCHVVSDVLRADRILTWDAGYDSWYDTASDCWLWYNTDVYPNSWQYWYEGISSDFGEYGWMEHDGEGWWIEYREGDWMQLPEKYDDADLWFIA